MKSEKHGIGDHVRGIFQAVATMPATVKQLAPVQMITWLGLFCMWLYFGVAIARSVFDAQDTTSPAYAAGVEWGGICFGMYSLVYFFFSFVLPSIAGDFSGVHVSQSRIAI